MKTVLFMVGIEAIVIPMYIVFVNFTVESQTSLLVMVIALGTIGFAAVGTLFAAALDPETCPVYVDLNGFNPDDDAQWLARHYVPSIRSLGDVRTAARLIAPRKLTATEIHPGFSFADGSPL